MLQNLAFSISVILIAAIAAIFIVVIRKSHPGASEPEIEAGAAAKESAFWRSRIFWVLSLLFVPIIGFSLTRMPYVKAAALATDVVVDVTGYQWRWEMSQNTVPLNKLIEFRVTSTDVNHGFAIYDENARLLTQTQAMPTITNVLRYTFTKPGIYKVLCLEYCGVVHHNMMTEINVVADGTL
jgi:cytochrome c oxidase subunit 2